MRGTARSARLRTAVLVLLGGALSACGSTPAPGDAGSAPPGDPAIVTEGDVVQGVGTVLESPEHGPQLCFAVAESLPPQCGGPDVVGWDWDAVPHESAQGVRWTDGIAVVGRWEEGRLVLTEPPAAPSSPGAGAEPEDEFATRCPEPEGGWRPVDPARASEQELGEVQGALSSTPGFAGLWLDQGRPAEGGTPGEAERAADDPQRYVLNVRTTGDVAAYEERIRELWGGALCVSPAEHSTAELEEVAAQVPDVVPQDLLVGFGADVLTNRVEVDVIVATEDVQRELDGRFGPGVVVLRGQLQPRV
jgi:hypothetical protein